MAKQNGYNKKLNTEWQLRVGIRLSSKGSIVVEEDVKDSDLSDHYSEAWREGYLRKGYMNVTIQDLTSHLEPIFENGSDDQICKGFIIEMANPDGYCTKRGFSNYSLDQVALRVARRLMQARILKQGDQFHYNVIAYDKDKLYKNKQHTSATCLQNCKIIKKEKQPITFVELPLSPLLDKATTTNIEDDSYPAFYTHSAFKKAEEIARKGAALKPSVETGALLLGILCSCPESKEFFVIIKDVFELCDADKNTYSLSLTGRTWEHIQNLVHNLKKDPEICLYNIVGQCHGHNFIPEISGGSDNLQGCLISNTFASMDDRLWNSAVFHEEPCQLCHIFGLDINGKEVDSLFGLKDGRLLQRGYYLIPDFELESLC